jgi:hypothetical protein
MAVAPVWAHLALLRGTGNDRSGTRVQGLPWAACGVAQALLPAPKGWGAFARAQQECLCHMSEHAL